MDAAISTFVADLKQVLQITWSRSIASQRPGRIVDRRRPHPFESEKSIALR